jgi:hypothetical protein
MPPRTAGFGHRDRFELNGKIGLHRAARDSASGMPPVAPVECRSMNGEMPLHYHAAVGLWHEGCVLAPAGPFVERVTYIGRVLYALRHKENVATEYAQP